MFAHTELICFLFSILYQDCGSTFLLLGWKVVAAWGSPSSPELWGDPHAILPLCASLFIPPSQCCPTHSRGAHLMYDSDRLRVQVLPPEVRFKGWVTRGSACSREMSWGWRGMLGSCRRPEGSMRTSSLVHSAFILHPPKCLSSLSPTPLFIHPLTRSPPWSLVQLSIYLHT